MKTSFSAPIRIMSWFSNITVIILLSPSAVTAQEQHGGWHLRELFYPGFAVDSLEHNCTSTERTELLKRLCLSDIACDYCLPDSGLFDQTFAEFRSSHEASIHFFDPDHDGDCDILFDGKTCEGFETGIVEIYENRPDSLLLRFSREGTLAHFNSDSMTFVIYDYPCCAQQSHFLTTYRLNISTFRATAESTGLLVGNGHWLGGPFFPKTLTCSEPFTITDTTELRWSPNTTDRDQWDNCNSGTSNVIGTYPPGAHGTILYKTKDGWLFVRMDPHETSGDPCMDNGFPNPEGLPVSNYGWVRF